MYHLHDGPEQQKRDKELRRADYMSPNPWKFADGPYQKELLGFDSLRDSKEKYDAWKQKQT